MTTVEWGGTRDTVMVREREGDGGAQAFSGVKKGVRADSVRMAHLLCSFGSMIVAVIDRFIFPDSAPRGAPRPSLVKMGANALW